MKLLIGKTFYLTNEYLHNNENSAGIIAESNIETIKKNYKCLELSNLKDFNKESIDSDTYILDKLLDTKYKRPKSILIENKDQKILFIRDDIFPIIDNKIKLDPVIDYKEYCSIENKMENIFINKLYQNELKDKIDYNTFISNYHNQKSLGNISFDYDKVFKVDVDINKLIVKHKDIKNKLEIN